MGVRARAVLEDGDPARRVRREIRPGGRPVVAFHDRYDRIGYGAPMGRPPSAPDTIRLAEASRLLAVGDTTLKRWTEEGRISCERTLGGHRRFRRSEVERLRASLLGLRPADSPPVASPTDTREWLDEPDPTDPTAVLSRLLLLRSRSRDWAEAGDRLCSGLLSEIGERWADGRMTCAQEHVMSRSVESALTRISHQIPVPPGAPVVLLACPVGERHSLGLTLVETLLRERGVAVLYLGADVPTSDLADAIRATRPVAVGLSASSLPRPASELAEVARAAAQACADVKSRLYLGGAAAWAPLRGAQRVLTLMDLVPLLDPVLPRPSPA